MTMIDQTTPIRPGTCPMWCVTDHSQGGASGDWHTAAPGPWVDASALDTDAMAVTLEQYVLEPTAATAIRVDVDSVGAVAFLTPQQAVRLAEHLLAAARTATDAS